MRSPGESIKSILDYRNISIKQLAIDLEISYQRMLKIVENIEPLDEDICRSLEMVLGFRAEYWRTLQQVWYHDK
jgi:plasmid maintenance system antidote protein VapI